MTELAVTGTFDLFRAAVRFFCGIQANKATPACNSVDRWNFPEDPQLSSSPSQADLSHLPPSLGPICQHLLRGRASPLPLIRRRLASLGYQQLPWEPRHARAQHLGSAAESKHGDDARGSG